jgi:hypothetical protein
MQFLVMLFDILPQLNFFVLSFHAVPTFYFLVMVFDIVPRVNCVVMLFDRMIYVEDKSNSFVMLYDAVPKKCYLRTRDMFHLS